MFKTHFERKQRTPDLDLIGKTNIHQLNGQAMRQLSLNVIMKILYTRAISFGGPLFPLRRSPCGGF